MGNAKRKAAIIGSGQLACELMERILRDAQHLEVAAMAGDGADGEGLALAARQGVATTAGGVVGLVRMPGFTDIDFVFDASCAETHEVHDVFLRGYNPALRMIDLTGAASAPRRLFLVNRGPQLAAASRNQLCAALSSAERLAQSMSMR